MNDLPEELEPLVSIRVMYKGEYKHYVVNLNTLETTPLIIVLKSHAYEVSFKDITDEATRGGNNAY